MPAAIVVETADQIVVTEHRPSSGNWPGLILEVTEDQIVRDVALTRKIAGESKTCGVAIAIDDFGAGYSSFSGLRDLPLRRSSSMVPLSRIAPSILQMPRFVRPQSI